MPSDASDDQPLVPEKLMIVPEEPAPVFEKQQWSSLPEVVYGSASPEAVPMSDYPEVSEKAGHPVHYGYPGPKHHLGTAAELASEAEPERAGGWLHRRRNRIILAVVAALIIVAVAAGVAVPLSYQR
jgi:hypothetical protein